MIIHASMTDIKFVLTELKLVFFLVASRASLLQIERAKYHEEFLLISLNEFNAGLAARSAE